ncbi:pulmonary surfactant-associated protein A-like [Crotalus adamanteus]|uniref:Pulmonary surfactant-associated protein A-like n=1 Tax=Crotalus adamanteus TaxID=8729 RepID=A0AAW1BEN1_CROAD
MNEKENNAILQIVKEQNQYTYLGIKESSVPGAFEYFNETPVNYTNWRLYEPNGKGERLVDKGCCLSSWFGSLP